MIMESAGNGTAPHALSLLKVTSPSKSTGTDGNAYLYILIVMSFYGVFLVGIMLGYVRSKRREKRRRNLFRRLLHEEEQREWVAMQRKHSLTAPALPVPLTLMLGNRRLTGSPRETQVLTPLSCALCSMEQSSVSSLCSSLDVRFTIEEESDTGAGEGLEGKGSSKGSSENSYGYSENLKVNTERIL